MNLPELARKTIESYFQEKDFNPPEETKNKYKDKKASFVTLIKKGMLRGCVGSLEPNQELWENVKQNAINAAFNDFRFMPLEKDELENTKIEVSILSQKKSIAYKNPDELLKKINKQMGIILKNGSHSATFLPKVWEQISDKKQFLEQLSLKACLDKNAWKTSKVFYYNVKVEN